MGHLALYVTFSVHLSTSLCLHRAPYLRNHTYSDHNFWCTCVKWWYLQDFFYLKKILRAKNSPKWKITITSITCHLRNSIEYEHDFWYTCVKWWYTQCFFVFLMFSKFWFSGGVSEENVSKWTKKLCCASYLRNHTWYGCHLWCTFLKWYLYTFSSFFQNFNFLGC